MSVQTLFGDLQNREGTAQRLDGDLFHFEERNPLDEAKLREIETELAAIIGGTKTNRAVVTVCSHAEYQQVLHSIMSERIRSKGLHQQFNVVANPNNPKQVFVGPSALAGLNDGQSNVVSEVVYALIAASGGQTNQAFERGSADLIAAELKERLDLDIFTDIYPAEREFTSVFLAAIKDPDEEIVDVLGLLRRSPRQFFQKVRASLFYKWWVAELKRDDNLSQYVNLLGSIAAPNGQIEGSFMQWAKDCAGMWVAYRQQQADKARARWEKEKSSGSER